jgi:4-hydroxybenzoate polyprenyltransferase
MSMLLLLLVVFVGPTSHIIRGADAFTHIMRLLGPRCNYYERHQHHCHLTTSHYVVSSTAVENQDILHEKVNIDEHYNSINTQRKKEKQNHNNDNSNIQPHLRKLLQLCRPINFPVVVILHLLGVHQSVQLYQKSHMIAATTTSSTSLFVTLLKDPAMLMVLLSLLLVTSTSMITNDYYDAREGVDSPYDSRHPLAAAAAAAAADAVTTMPHHGNSTITERVIPLSVAKNFTKCLYGILLLSSAFVPSIMARILVLSGAMITYLYTVHLKPITWIKNISCAALVALGPITSGCAAWPVLHSNSVIGSDSAVLSWFCILQSPLSFLVLSLFFGIMGREVLMDIIDYVGDARAGIETIPVRYGKRIATNVALVCSTLSSMSACVMPMWILFSRMLKTTRGGGSPLGLNTGGMTPTLIVFVQKSEARRLLLSLVGSGMLLRRIYDVWWTNGEDNTLVNRAIDESLLSVLLVLASFL